MRPPTCRSSPPAVLLLATALLSYSFRPAAAAAAACSAAGTCSAAFTDMQSGGLLDKRFTPGLARWYIPDDIPSLWTDDHENPPISFSEAYGHYTPGPNGIQFYDSHWIRFFYQWVYQMKRSPLRVHSPEAADFIFVPVCLGSWCGARPSSPLYFGSPAYKWTHSHIDRKTYFFQEAPKFLPWLGQKPHVMVFNGALPGDMKRTRAENFTFIGLEANLDMDPARFLVAPYPSHEHHDSYQPQPSLDSVMQQKQKLAVGIYVVRKAISDGTSNTRTLLHRSCTDHADSCTHITWDMGHNMTFKASAYSNYTSHWYCLQPPGDWILRGAFYDCVVAGGVPVVFNANYPKHVAFADVFDYKTMIQQAPTSAELQAHKTDYIGYLQRLHSDGNSTAKLEALQAVRRVLQYALNPDHYLISWKDRANLRPRDDAFTFSMKSLLRALCSQAGFKNGTQCQQPTAGGVPVNSDQTAVQVRPSTN